jgi:aminoglycoside phosphotransferase family enzyme
LNRRLAPAVYLEVVEIGEDANGTMKISAREYTGTRGRGFT